MHTRILESLTPGTLWDYICFIGDVSTNVTQMTTNREMIRIYELSQRHCL
jgi:hypothetical protein